MNNKKKTPNNLNQSVTLTSKIEVTECFYSTNNLKMNQRLYSGCKDKIKWSAIWLHTDYEYIWG